MRLYLAYGSNLSIEQMIYRCPDAVYVGTAELKDMCLSFKGNGYLTVDPCEGETVPVLVWRVSAEDEKNLDRYEGYPRAYDKVDTFVTVKNMVDGAEIGEELAFYYKMFEGAQYRRPSKLYWDVCMGGYRHFGFDPEFLFDAYDRSAQNERRSV